MIIIDEFSMIDCTIFITIEHRCRWFATKNGQYKPWGGHHVLLFGDLAQLLPSQYLMLTFLILDFGLKEVVRATEPVLSYVLLTV